MDQNNEQPRMTFEGEQLQRSSRSFQTSTPKVVEWVMTLSGGYIKDEKHARYVIFGFVALAFIASLLLVSGGGGVEPIDSETTPDVLPTSFL